MKSLFKSSPKDELDQAIADAKSLNQTTIIEGLTKIKNLAYDEKIPQRRADEVLDLLMKKNNGVRFETRDYSNDAIRALFQKKIIAEFRVDEILDHLINRFEKVDRSEKSSYLRSIGYLFKNYSANQAKIDHCLTKVIAQANSMLSMSRETAIDSIYHFASSNLIPENRVDEVFSLLLPKALGDYSMEETKESIYSIGSLGQYYHLPDVSKVNQFLSNLMRKLHNKEIPKFDHPCIESAFKGLANNNNCPEERLLEVLDVLHKESFYPAAGFIAKILEQEHFSGSVLQQAGEFFLSKVNAPESEHIAAQGLATLAKFGKLEGNKEEVRRILQRKNANPEFYTSDKLSESRAKDLKADIISAIAVLSGEKEPEAVKEHEINNPYRAKIASVTTEEEVQTHRSASSLPVEKMPAVAAPIEENMSQMLSDLSVTNNVALSAEDALKLSSLANASPSAIKYLQQFGENKSKAEADYLYIMSNTALQEYYVSFSRSLTGAVLACLSISSGMVADKRRFTAEQITGFIDMVGRSSNFPGVGIATGILSYIAKIPSDMERGRTIDGITTTFPTIASQGVIELIAAKLAIAQESVICSLTQEEDTSVFTKAEKTIEWFQSGGVKSRIERLAEKQAANLLDELMHANPAMSIDSAEKISIAVNYAFGGVLEIDVKMPTSSVFLVAKEDSSKDENLVTMQEKFSQMEKKFVEQEEDRRNLQEELRRARSARIKVEKILENTSPTGPSSSVSSPGGGLMQMQKQEQKQDADSITGGSNASAFGYNNRNVSRMEKAIEDQALFILTLKEELDSLRSDMSPKRSEAAVGSYSQKERDRTKKGWVFGLG